MNKETSATEVTEKPLESVVLKNIPEPEFKITEKIENKSIKEDTEKENNLSSISSKEITKKEKLNEEVKNSPKIMEEIKLEGLLELAPEKKKENFSMKTEFWKTVITPNSPKFLQHEESKNLLNSTDRKDRINEFNSEESHNLEVLNSTKLVDKSLRKPDTILLNKGSLPEGVSTLTANQSSDMITAHFHSVRQRSMTSNDSPIHNKDFDNIREGYEDPLIFLKRFDLLFE